MMPLDNALPLMLTYKPMKYRPVVSIPGKKPHTCAREFDRIEDAVRWAQGFVQGPGSYIRPGTSVRIADMVYACVALSNGAHRLQFAGAVRPPGSVV